MADWENLPQDLLISLATKSPNLSANIRFTGVCRSWRLAGLKDRQRLMERTQIPGIVLAPFHYDNLAGGDREFILVTEIINNNHHVKKKPIHLVPWRLSEWRLCIGGTSSGWILFLDCDDLKMALVNPTTGSQVGLPEHGCPKIKREEFGSWGFWHSRRVSIWAPHSAPVSDWFVFVLMPGEHWKSYIQYCRVGDRGWSVMEFPVCQFGMGFIVDALCSRVEAGHLYVLISTGELFCCDFFKRTNTTVASHQQVHEAFKSGQEFNYLVEAGGEILVLHRNRERQGCAEVYKRTRGFDVYRLDREGMQWVEIKEFGEFAVFIGFGQPFSVPITEEESSPGIQGSRIYFLEMPQLGCRESWCRIGVFHLRTSTINFFLVDSGFSTPCAGKPVRVPIPIAPVPCSSSNLA